MNPTANVCYHDLRAPGHAGCISTMSEVDSRTSFAKILALESDKGYTDGAVIGGLDRYLARLVETEWNSLPAALLAQINLVLTEPGGYAALDEARRWSWVTKALALAGVDDKAAKTSVGKTPRRRTTGTDKGTAHTAPTPTTPASSTPSNPTREPGILSRPVTAIRGISTKTAALLTRLGVTTIDDLLHLLPRRYLDFTRIVPIARLQVGQDQTIVGQVQRSQPIRMGSMQNTQAYIADATGTVRALWFNQPWLARQMQPGRYMALSGQVRWFGGSKVMESPEWEPADSSGLHTGRLVPVYPLTRGLSARSMRKWVAAALEAGRGCIREYLPPDIIERHHLASLQEAIQQTHFPDDIDKAARGRRRLAFDELLALQLGLVVTKRRWQTSQPARPMTSEGNELAAFVSELPFELTTDQRKAISEISHDLARPVPMARLLQGDVGSGKTVVAVYSLLISVMNGQQGALMAPTEVLAEQHLKTCIGLLRGPNGSVNGAGTSLSKGESLRDNPIQTIHMATGRKVTVALLLGSLSLKQRRAVHAAIRSGDVDIAIGTQALVQEEVAFNRLALAIVDEQHRFGVSQRGQLRQKGFNPHVLVMTATPIPRSLALAVYGDLDLSAIHSIPAGRQVIETHVVPPEAANKVYPFVRKHVDTGRQAYVVCPLIEESDKLGVTAATEEYEHLSRHIFPDLRVGLLHGGLRTDEKERIMRTFRDGNIDVLVSTTVIEVGVDVPNATVMVILGADRFGLSQLHQLRGRVGRGTHKSYCLLLAETPTLEAKRRLNALKETSDGFALAEQDLALRGPGDFLGTQQSGLPELRVATLTDLSILEQTRDEAQRLVNERDFETGEQYIALRERVQGLWQSGMEWS